jgi:SAM-dependent methyltransferase
MLAEDTPRFAGWDQDAAALAHDYAGQLPSIVGPTLVASAYAVGDLYASVPPLAWQRQGVRSNGSQFTIETLGRYHLHDVVHHLHDVRAGASAATVRAYDDFAPEYAASHDQLPGAVATAVARLAALLPPGSRVLEIGSAGGRDAEALEQAGLVVRRTDVTARFVRMLEKAGHRADVVDPLTDDLADPAAPGTPYDAVWANASLLHVARADLPVLLGRLAAVTRPGGLLHLTLKEGDGEGWSTHGDVAAPRYFTYWREEALRQALADAGWSVEHLAEHEHDEAWLEVLATRA